MNDLYYTDKKAQELGAKYYHDEIITQGPTFDQYHWHFARHYFVDEDKEICYTILPLHTLQNAGHVSTFEQSPRVWETPRNLKPL